MERLLFREEQPVRNTFIPWLMLAAWLVSAGSFGYGFYRQLYLGIPYGDEPMSDTGLLATGIGVVFILGLLVVVSFTGMLVTEVRTGGFYYRFTPFMRDFKGIPREEISSFEVKKYNPLTRYGGWGYRKQLFARSTAINIGGNKGVILYKTNGRNILFSTRDMPSMQKAMEQMMNHHDLKYNG